MARSNAIALARHIWPALVAATVGSALVLFDGTVITVALPSIQRELRLLPDAQGWVVQAYLLAPIAVLPAGGAIADRLGRRFAFCLGAAVFVVGSVVCAVAQDGAALITGRAIQGAAVGLVLPASLAMLAAAAQSRKERQRVIALWTVWISAASAAGPVFGGALAGGPGWRWIFWLSAALTAGAFVLARWGVRESRDESAQPPEWRGAGFLILGVTGTGLALGQGRTAQFGDADVLVPLVAAIVGFVGFIVRERTAPEPLIPTIMFTHKMFRVANLLTATVYGGLFAALYFVAIYLQQAERLTPVEAGLAMLPFAAALVGGAPLGTWLTRFGGPRVAVTAGCITGGGALLVLGLTQASVVVIVVLAAVAGIGLGAAAGPLMSAVVDTVELRRAAIATGVNASISRLAAIVAIAGLGLVSSVAFEDALARERVSAEAREEVGGRVFASPARLEREGFSATQVERTEEASESSFQVVMLVAGAVLVGSALVAVVGLGTPLPDQTGEMPISVMTAPMAVVLRERLPAMKPGPRRRAAPRAPPRPPG